MAKVVENGQVPGDRPAYDPPRAMRLADARGAKGACAPVGSGDADCTRGNSADPSCQQSGQSATGMCATNGLDPAGDCFLFGMGVVY